MAVVDPSRAYAPTHEVVNQAPPLVGYNVFEEDRPLVEALEREGAGWAREQAREVGAFAGGEGIELGRQANENPPILRTHDRYGNRIDEVEFHPAWHRLMDYAVSHGAHSLPWTADRPGGHAARAAIFMPLGQAEAGQGCPMSMTYSGVPALRATPELAAEWEPLLTSNTYDPRLVPAADRARNTRSSGTSGSAPRRCATPSSCSRRPTAGFPASCCRAFCPTVPATASISSA